jgi:5-methylcytosine-specific restriction endonuclease McrA
VHCIKCNGLIIGKRRDAKYCSDRCKKNFNGKKYRQLNKVRLVEYKHTWRRAKNGGNRPPRNAKKYREDKCLNCGISEDLQLAHIKPLFAGGTHKYVITLCRKHHTRFDNLLRDFWKDGLSG